MTIYYITIIIYMTWRYIWAHLVSPVFWNRFATWLARVRMSPVSVRAQACKPNESKPGENIKNKCRSFRVAIWWWANIIFYISMVQIPEFRTSLSDYLTTLEILKIYLCFELTTPVWASLKPCLVKCGLRLNLLLMTVSDSCILGIV